jgi:hypothetical protein
VTNSDYVFGYDGFDRFFHCLSPPTWRCFSAELGASADAGRTEGDFCREWIAAVRCEMPLSA